MSLDLTPCGHLREDSKGHPVFCDKCRPASQKHEPLNDQQAAILVVNTITPILEQWFKSGKVTPAQVGGNLMGMAVAIAMETQTPKEHLLELVEACYGNPDKPTIQ